MLEMSPEYQQLAKENPMMAEMLKNPELLRSSLSPENIRLAQALQGMGGMNGMMPGRSLNRQLSSEEIRARYPDAVRQIEDMGFTVDDNVLQTLYRFNGNVEMTINFLIQYGCLLLRQYFRFQRANGEPPLPFGIRPDEVSEAAARHAPRGRGREADSEEAFREEEGSKGLEQVRHMLQYGGRDDSPGVLQSGLAEAIASGGGREGWCLRRW